MTSKTVFVAGATGAIGMRLLPLLVARGHRVFGLTRSASKCDVIRSLGATPVVGDVFDRSGLSHALMQAKADVVIHQLTDLPRDMDPSRMEEGIRRNARIRSEGTANLVAAARANGVALLVAQSIAWAYAPGAEPHAEDAPLDTGASGLRAVSVAGVMALEQAVLNENGMIGIVLRYGQIHGPGTGSPDASGKKLPLHVEAAARAAVLAMDAAQAGIYNVVGPNAEVDAGKARRVLGWSDGA